MLALRPYQSDLINEARAIMRGGVRRLCIQGATGMGKTVLAAQLLAQAAERGKRSWFVCHRKEILDQTVRTFVESADLHVGIVAAGYPSDATAPVQVCSVQSLLRRMTKIRKPDLIVFDETHHILASTWAAIARECATSFQIGITATPCRTDGRGLRPFFDSLLCGPSTADLIAAGYLSPYRLFAPAQFDASALHKVAGDFNRKEVTAAMKPTVIGDAVGTYRRHAEGGRALVFAWSLDASRAIAEAFNAAGIAAAHVDGETPADERRRSMEGFRDGRIRVLCNVELFGEGLDVPAVDAVFLLRPTASLGLHLQQCGRGLRPAPGKSCVRLFDHVGNYTRHGLPDDPRAWTLDGISKAASERLSPMKRCSECFLVSGVLAKACPHCGAAYPVKPRKVVQVAGELAETKLSALRARLPELQRSCSTLKEFQALAVTLGYKPQWAWLAFQRAIQHRKSPIAIGAQ